MVQDRGVFVYQNSDGIQILFHTIDISSIDCLDWHQCIKKWENAMQGSGAFKTGADLQLKESDGVTSDFCMIDFYRIDGVDRHRCKMGKMREVNSQVRSSRTLWATRLFFCCFGESWPPFQLYVFDMEATWMTGELTSQFVLTRATYRSRPIR